MVPEMAVDSSVGRGVVTRDRLIDEAAKLFAEKGYAGATTRELAARLGIQRASLYYHMAGKDEILLEICKAAMTQGLNDVRQAIADMPEDDALARVKQLIATHLETSLTNRDRHLTMLLELRSLKGSGEKEIRALRHEYEALIDGLFEQAQAQGTIRDDVKPSELRMVMLNLLNWSLTWFSPGVGFTPQTWGNLVTKMFIDGAKA
jgi:AcrR family transcriptional regulator